MTSIIESHFFFSSLVKRLVFRFLNLLKNFISVFFYAQENCKTTASVKDKCWISICVQVCGFGLSFKMKNCSENYLSVRLSVCHCVCVRLNAMVNWSVEKLDFKTGQRALCS